MGYIAQLTIPKVNSNTSLKLYIYRSKNADDINTISKVSVIQPIIVIDQDQAITSSFNGQDCYIIKDEPTTDVGITYIGPQINTVPINEYETTINLVMLNSYTPVNELILSPLELNHKEGIVYYYSVIAVDESNNQMSHLSKVNGVLIKYVNETELKRQIWSCNDYKDSEEDVWTIVNTIDYDETDTSIKIGDTTKPYNISKLGIPIVETVPQIQEIDVSLNSLISNTFMVLEVQNPWQNNNKAFNYRKLKSYKIANIYNNTYGDFSVPTYQSELPVSIEKMIIVMKTNPEDKNKIIPYDDSEANKFEIIRRNGIYYQASKHKSLGYNLWSIPLESNTLSVYSEASIQDTINIQISASVGNLYVFDIYLVDVYQNISSNTHYILET